MTRVTESELPSGGPGLLSSGNIPEPFGTHLWLPSTGWPGRLNYLSSCVSLRSALPSAFTMYTSLLRR